LLAESLARADQSISPARRATTVSIRSWIWLASGIGTSSESAAARARRVSFKPRAILKPARSYCSLAMSQPYVLKIGTENSVPARSPGIDADRLPHQNKGLSQTIDDAHDQDIAAQLDKMAVGGFSSMPKGLLPHGIEQRLTTGDGFHRAGHNNEELAGNGGIWPPNTGAATASRWVRASSSARRSDRATLIVLIEMRTVFLLSAARTPPLLQSYVSRPRGHRPAS
jgi:hypothetical protein